MKKHHFPVVIEQDEDGVFIVSCPLFKGCHSYGVTIDEAMENIGEVIEMCLDEQKDSCDGNTFIGVRDYEVAVG